MNNDAQKTYVYKSAMDKVRDMIEEMQNDHNDGWVQEAYRLELKYIKRLIEVALNER